VRLSLDPHAIHQRLVALGEEWAEANAAAALLEEAKRTVEAKLTNDALGRERVSKAASEVEALAHPDYRAHIEAMVEGKRGLWAHPAYA
jgi:hypothetical protein